MYNVHCTVIRSIQVLYTYIVAVHHEAILGVPLVLKEDINLLDTKTKLIKLNINRFHPLLGHFRGG